MSKVAFDLLLRFHFTFANTPCLISIIPYYVATSPNRRGFAAKVVWLNFNFLRQKPREDLLTRETNWKNTFRVLNWNVKLDLKWEVIHYSYNVISWITKVFLGAIKSPVLLLHLQQLLITWFTTPFLKIFWYVTLFFGQRTNYNFSSTALSHVGFVSPIRGDKPNTSCA